MTACSILNQPNTLLCELEKCSDVANQHWIACHNQRKCTDDVSVIYRAWKGEQCCGGRRQGECKRMKSKSIEAGKGGHLKNC